MSPQEVEAAVKSLPGYDWSSEEIGLRYQDAVDANCLSQAKQHFSTLRKLGELTDQSFLEAIGATKNGMLTKAGLLFLGKASVIEAHIGLFEFRFSWKTRAGELLINEVWSGCLWEAIHKASSHFDSCNKFLSFEWRGVKHFVPTLDSVAFHEGFLNALVHRDYSRDGMVSVDYFGNKMTITSPGQFYGGVNSDNIFKHQPRHRNKALARTLMALHFVDRAGMGVRRMSQRSLMYGRQFPQFVERDGAIEVSMDAEYMRAPIFVLAQDIKNDYGVPELLVLNILYGKDRVPVSEVISRLSVLSDEPWEEFCRILHEVPHLEMCANREEVVVRIKNKFAQIFDISKQWRPARVSEKLVALYVFLRKHGSASNADLCSVLGYAHSSQTSGFLRSTKFVVREGSGPAAVWSLVS
jgi:hypothetical protein